MRNPRWVNFPQANGGQLTALGSQGTEQKRRGRTGSRSGRVLLTWPLGSGRADRADRVLYKQVSRAGMLTSKPARDTCFMAASESFPPPLSGFDRGVFILFPSDSDPHHHGIISSSGSKSGFIESNRKSPQRNFSPRSLATFCNHFSERVSAQNSPSCPHGQGSE